jgi:thiamine pyrophosphate-dependent acetolactate synthase large subunit-like protein
VCNNKGYASVKLAFDSFNRRSKNSGDSEGCSVTNPSLDIPRLCEGLGAKALRVEKEDRLEDALKNSLGSKGVFVLDVAIDPEERGYEGSVGSDSAWT